MGKIKDQGDTPSWMPQGFQDLIKASAAGDLDKVQSLLDSGVDPNGDFGAPRGWSPLMEAAYHGHLEVAKLLVKHKADVKAVEVDRWWTALDLAIYAERKKIVDYLKSVQAPLGEKVPNRFRGGKLGGWVTDER